MTQGKGMIFEKSGVDEQKIEYLVDCTTENNRKSHIDLSINVDKI